MTEDELIEEAAKAMLIVDYPGATWDQTVVSVKNAWLDMARAALAVVDRARQDDWEYGIEYEIDSERSEFTLAHSERQARKWVAESPTDTGLRRRHPATEWEPVPDTEGSKK